MHLTAVLKQCSHELRVIDFDYLLAHGTQISLQVNDMHVPFLSVFHFDWLNARLASQSCYNGCRLLVLLAENQSCVT